jgi:hypothetical protein
MSGDLKPVVTPIPGGLFVYHPTDEERVAHRRKIMAGFGSLRFVGSPEEAKALQHFMETRGMEFSYITKDAYDSRGQRIKGHVQLDVVEAPGPQLGRR